MNSHFTSACYRNRNIIQMALLLTILLSFLFVRGNAERKLPYKIKGPKSFGDKIAIVGAGPSGIHMAYLLKQKGFTNVHILEKSSRIGGKVHTVYHRNTPLDFGAIEFDAQFRYVYELVKKFLPNQFVKMTTRTIWYHNWSMPETFKAYLYYIRNVLGGKYKNMDNDSIHAEFMDARKRYDVIFEEIFGKFEGAVFPKPKNIELIKGTFYDYLARNNLTILLPYFHSTTQTYGYNYLDQMSAFYGLVWNSILTIPFDLSKVTSYMFKCGYQKLWQLTVEKERLRVTFNVDIRKVYRKYEGDRPKIWLYMATGNKPAKWEHFDFLIWSPEMQTSMKRWVNKIPLERELLSRTIPTFYTVSIVDSKDELHGLHPMNIFPENMIEEGDGRVHTMIDSYSIIHNYTGPKYQSVQYPLADDNKPMTTYLIYQQSIPRRSDEEVMQLIRNHFKHMSASSIKIVNSKTWRYFPRYSVSDIENGIIWKIIEMQGKYGMWYIGSSVYFECVHHVTSYNAFLVENMKMPVE